MKKLIIITIVLSTLSCNTNDDTSNQTIIDELIGTWILNKHIIGGIERTDPSYLCSIGNETYVFNPDLTFGFIGYHSSTEGNCEINTSDVYSGVFAVSSNEITLNHDGGIDLAQFEIINNQLFVRAQNSSLIYDKE